MAAKDQRAAALGTFYRINFYKLEWQYAQTIDHAQDRKIHVFFKQDRGSSSAGLITTGRQQYLRSKGLFAYQPLQTKSIPKSQWR